jgi:hypothetical protein
VIIDNEKGLLIDFKIIGSNLAGHPRQLGLYNVNFGTIPAGKVSVGQWWFTSSLLGHFVSYNATINHLDSYGNRDLSLVSSVNLHELTHSVMAYGSLYDTVADFMVNEIPDGHDYPDKLYYSDGTTTAVAIADSSWTDGPVTITDTIVNLTVKPHVSGWNYTTCNDPGNGLYRIAAITRHDGQVIPLNNMWLTYCTIPDGGDPVYENKLHFADLFTGTDTVGYTVLFTPIDQDQPWVVSILGVPQTATTDPVDSLDVVFSEPIIDSTFTVDDITLRCQGGPNLMDTTITIVKISDLSGNYGRVGKMVSWLQAMSVPAISLFIGVPTTPGEPIDSLMVMFNMPIYDSTFTLDQLRKVKNNSDTLSITTLSITPADNNHLLFNIKGLLPVSGSDGHYKLIVKVPSVWGRNGQHGIADQSTVWTVCTTSPPTAFAGNDTVTCSNDFYQPTGMITNASSVVWSTSGTGNFFNASTLNPVYHPSPLDIVNGFVLITLTAHASNNCSPPAVSTFRLNFVNAPYAHAGNGATLLYGQPFTVTNAMTFNGLSLTWTSSGTGEFSDPHALMPVYTPSAADSGSLTLTLTVPWNSPCQPAVSTITVNYAKPVHPAIQASNLLFSNPDTASAHINWTDGNGEGRIVFMKQDTTGFPEPEMASFYLPDTEFGSGSQIGNSGWYCVFNGTDHQQGISVTNLQPGTKYRLMVLEYNETFGLSFYLAQTASMNPANHETCPVVIPQISGDTAVCENAFISFSTNQGMNEYLWDVIPDGTVSSGQGTVEVSVVCNMPGYKTVRAKYRLPSGCPSAFGEFTFYVRPLPSDTNAITGSPSVCYGATGINYYDSSFVNTISYQWSVPSYWSITQGQGGANILVSFTSGPSSGIISVYGINGCGQGPVSTISVTVNPPLVGAVGLQNKTIHPGQNLCYAVRKISVAGSNTYYHILPGGAVTMIASDTMKLRSGFVVYPGAYFHGLATKYCVPCQTNKSAVLTPGPDEQTGDPTSTVNMAGTFFRVYPNPTSGDFTLEWLNHDVRPSDVRITIKDMLGKVIQESDIGDSFGKKFSLATCKPGIYIISVSGGNDQGMDKIVKW